MLWRTANDPAHRAKAFLAKLDKGEIPLADAKAKARELFAAELAAIK